MHEQLSQAFAFLGNSLLAPMTQTGAYGLDPSLWEEFPTFDDEGVANAVAQMRDRADSLVRRAETRDEAIHDTAVEFTRLFVGPPKPAAAPWETFYVAPGVTVGYGQPAIDMKRLLADMGLEVGGESNQYPDHMGIELLCLAEMHARAAQGEKGYAQRAREFAATGPGSWASELRQAVLECKPDGYYAGLLGLACTLLEYDAGECHR